MSFSAPSERYDGGPDDAGPDDTGRPSARRSSVSYGDDRPRITTTPTPRQRPEAPRPGPRTGAPRVGAPRPPASARARSPRPTGRTQHTTVHSARGLTIAGVAVIGAGSALLGLLLDDAVSGRLGWGFRFCFVAGALACAWLVRRTDMLAAIVTPPIVFAAVLLVVALFGSGPGGLLSRTLVDLAVGLALGAPALFAATAGAAALTYWRRRRS